MGNRNSYGRKPNSEPKHKSVANEASRIKGKMHDKVLTGDPKQYVVAPSQLPKTHPKYRPAAGSQRHTKSVHLEGKWKQRHKKQPFIIRQAIQTNSELRLSCDGITRVWTDKKWVPKGKIPKGF